jgi:hypothetical protein
MVMQTTDEFTNLRMMFRHEVPVTTQGGQVPSLGSAEVESLTGPEKNSLPIESEAQALSQIRAMPIYFASSYSLVRPYVAGFEANVLDVASLKNVKIDLNWREANTASLFRPD